MNLDEVKALHITTDGMDAHTWVVFAIVLGPVLLMIAVVAWRVRQDVREEEREAMGTAGGDPRL